MQLILPPGLILPHPTKRQVRRALGSSNYRCTKKSLFVDTPLADWRTLRRLRIQACPYRNCESYTVAYSLNIDGTPGDAITGWPGESIDIPFYPWWDSEVPWCWFTTNFITTTSASNQTINNPATWNSASNTVEVIASGGGAGSSIKNSGGAASYAKSVNLALTPSAPATFFGNVGGTGTAANTNASTSPPTNGADAWYNGATLAASGCGAKGGLAGDGTSFGAPGLASGCIFYGTGSVAYNGGPKSNVGSGGTRSAGGAAGPAGVGGAGGTGTGAATTAGGSGGGANGGGGNGAAVTTTVSVGFAGGNSITTGAQTAGTGGSGAASFVAGGVGGVGAGGGGGWGDATNASPGGAGGAGDEWDSTHGSGGAGGSGGQTSATSGAAMGAGPNGALYGGGGACGPISASGTYNGSGGVGGQYIIVLTWTPLALGGDTFITSAITVTTLQ